MDREALLARTSLFGGISDTSRRALAEICLPRQVKRSQIVFTEGQKGYAVYVLVTGSIQLYKLAPDARRIVIKVVKPGELFGEVVLFEQGSYPVSGVALRDSLLYAVPKHQFVCLLEDKSFRSDFLSGLMAKLRYLAEQIKYLSAHDVTDRLLLFFREQYGREGRIMCPLSKKQVAAAIGVAPETLSRVLVSLRDQGMTWRGGVVTVPDAVWRRVGD